MDEERLSGAGGPEIRTKIVYRTRSSAGLVSGMFGSVFAILGIFTIGLLFLPFAVLFSFVSLMRSASGLSASGFCAAIASSILAVIGFSVSPTTWLLLLGLIGIAAQSGNHSTANNSTPPTASDLMQSPVAGPPIDSPPSATPQAEATPDVGSDNNSSLPDSTMPSRTSTGDQTPSQPATPQLSSLQGFEAGAADRAVMEAWFDGLSGSFKDGAEFWAANRSLRPQPTCESQEGSHSPDFYQGCLAAKAQLDQVDARRLSDPEYRAGWNMPPA